MAEISTNISANSAYKFVPDSISPFQHQIARENFGSSFEILDLSDCGAQVVVSFGERNIVNLTPMAEIPDAYFSVVGSRLFSIFDNDEG